MNFLTNSRRHLFIPAALLSLCSSASAQIPAFPLTTTGLEISRPTQPPQPFTVAGQSGVLVGTQDGQFESWINPIKLISHLTIEANLEGYSVPIPVNPQSANIEVRPDHTTITYSHPGFTIRQIMFSPDGNGVAPVSPLRPGMDASNSNETPRTGPIVLFQIDSMRPLDLIFRFTPEMRWMWPRRNDGVPSPEWVPNQPPTPSNVAEPGQPDGPGMYILHLDYPDLAGAITIPTATPGILAPYQERPQVHPLELRLHYDPRRDGSKYFPLLMSVATSKEAATTAALRQSIEQLNASIPEAYKAHAAQYAKLQSESTSIETPDKALNEAFKWGVVSIEQLKAREYTTGQTALVAGYYASGDSARPGFGWFFGRDALYTLYAVNSFGDFALTRAELEFLIARQRTDGKIMHEFSQTAGDPSVDWKQFSYMYAAADATPLFLMAMRDYLRASGDTAFIQVHKEAIEKAWSFETAESSDTDHDGIYDNSQGTGWVESWPNRMPHQEVYLALLDQQASTAYAALQTALGDPSKSTQASTRATKIHTTIEQEYYDPQKGCYAFSHNPPVNGQPDPNGTVDKATTVYPAIAWWDSNSSGIQAVEGFKVGRGLIPGNKSGKLEGALAPEGSQPLAHPEACLQQFAAPTLDTDWGLRDVATTEPFYDGLSYHQGSVWPLFTGWAALAEYRANQPLAAQQMLMQNVDLTWAQDPGAVTELLSGDFYVPFGRSTSHQLWSSAMVITPTLRGLFGINLDAATNTITVNPHLPPDWDYASVDNIHLGEASFSLNFARKDGVLNVFANPTNQSSIAAMSNLKLRSDVSGTREVRDTSKRPSNRGSMAIPLPTIEPILPQHVLPTSGSRTSQLKILSAEYGENQLTLQLTGEADSTQLLYLRENGKTRRIQIKGDPENRGPVTKLFRVIDGPLKDPSTQPLSQIDPSWQPWSLELHFPKGEGYQTLELTLTW